MRRILLVDGHYFLYRSFFAIQGLTNSRGEPTNAIFGFVKALLKMFEDVQPTAAAVVWDYGMPQHRVELQPQYKQNRPPMPDDLRVQERWLQEHITAFGPASVRVKNCEADDLIASYVKVARAAGYEVVIATNDKDIWQLVGEGVSIYSTGKTSDFALLGPREVEEKWGVPPALIGDILALTGDASDNIPGVEGIGEKTAAKLIAQFGSLANLLANVEKIEQPRAREKIATSRKQILSNAEMVRLDASVPLPMPIEELPVELHYEAATEALRQCECHSLMRSLERKHASGQSQPALSAAPVKEPPSEQLSLF